MMLNLNGTEDVSLFILNPMGDEKIAHCQGSADSAGASCHSGDGSDRSRRSPCRCGAGHGRTD